MTTPPSPSGWTPIDRDRPRIIVNAAADDYLLVGRIVRKVTSPDYVWPADGITFQSFEWGDKHYDFGVRRNKSCITIWGPKAHTPAPPVPE